MFILDIPDTFLERNVAGITNQSIKSHYKDNYSTVYNRQP